MNDSGALPAYAGWFGKIPSLGDFVTRLLPASFVAPWDAWLSGELVQARQVLGGSWDETYARAPTLCFSLAAGALDEHAWHGVLVPSLDRVGRQFPLTIALSCPPAVAATFGRPGWAALVASGRRALESDVGSEGVDEGLRLFIGQHLRCTAPADPHPGRIESALARLPERTGLWWSVSSERSAGAVPIIFYALPRGAWFRELLGSR